MIRQIAVAGIIAASMLAAGDGAWAAYRIEHVNWGNYDAGNDRIYVRDGASGRHMVLSRHWGSRCNRREALNYGLEGGCWYPVRESYSSWQKMPQGWLRLSAQTWAGRSPARRIAVSRIHAAHRVAHASLLLRGRSDAGGIRARSVARIRRAALGRVAGGASGCVRPPRLHRVQRPQRPQKQWLLALFS